MDTVDYRKQYVGVLGSATAQQLIRKIKSAWKSFFSLKEKGERCFPPGYLANEDDGRTLRIYICNDQHTLELGNRSRLEIPVEKKLNEKYGLGYTGRLRLEVAGVPKWDGKQGRLKLHYGESSNQFKTLQSDTVDGSRLNSPLASEEAAPDIGANNLVACTTAADQQYLYEGRGLFNQFRDITREIARPQSELCEGQYPQTGFDNCTDNARDGATTHRTCWYATSSNARTTRVSPRCTLRTSPTYWSGRTRRRTSGRLFTNLPRPPKSTVSNASSTGRLPPGSSTYRITYLSERGYRLV